MQGYCLGVNIRVAPGMVLEGVKEEAGGRRSGKPWTKTWIKYHGEEGEEEEEGNEVSARTQSFM
jgi:hypothetical protein